VAGIRAGQTRDDLDEGALARSVVTDQPDDLPGVDAQVEAVQRDHVPVSLVQSSRDQHASAAFTVYIQRIDLHCNRG
jgi:hypothetical protein